MPAESIDRLWLQFRIQLLSSGVRTLDRLSLATGIERSKLSRISTGVIRPSPDEQAAIARALGVTPDELFRAGRGDV